MYFDPAYTSSDPLIVGAKELSLKFSISSLLPVSEHGAFSRPTVHSHCIFTDGHCEVIRDFCLVLSVSIIFLFKNCGSQIVMKRP